MSRLLSCVVLAALACGCDKPPEEVSTPKLDRAVAPPKGDDQPAREPKFPDEVKLPEAVGARALGKAVEYPIYLTVNSKGQVLLTPDDQFKDREGEVIATLENPVQVESFLKRRAKEDRDAANLTPAGGKGPIQTTIEKMEEPEDGAPQKPLRSILILRVDRQTPFEKAYPIWRAAQRAEFTKAQWRALRPGGAGEGQITVVIPRSEDDASAAIPLPNVVVPVQYDILVTADGKGKIAKITLWEEEDPLSALLPELPGKEKPPAKAEPAQKPITDLGTDVGALAKKLKELAAKHKGKKLIRQFELDGRLLQADVIRLIDAANGAGFTDVGLILLDKMKR